MRGGSISSCLSRSNSSDSELNLKLFATSTPPRPNRDTPRTTSESSQYSLAAKRGLSTSMDSCCRICHDGDNEEKLMTACKCLGSIKHVHHACLLNWVSRSGDLTCEICKHNYTVTRSRRKTFTEWRFPGIGIQGWLHLVLFFAFFAMLVTSVTWIVWSQTSKSSAAVFERTSTEIKYAYMLNGIFIFTAVIGIILDSCRQGKKYFQRVLALNQEIFIQEYVEKKDESLLKKSCKGMSTTQSKLTLNSLRGNDKSLSVNCRLLSDQDGGSSDLQSQEENQSDLIGESVFVEIDIDDDTNSYIFRNSMDQRMEYVKDFKCLQNLAETCI
eukprot:gene13997-4965_t